MYDSINEALICPLCKAPLNNSVDMGPQDSMRINCSNCGDHLFGLLAFASLDKILRNAEDRAKAAYAVYGVDSKVLITRDMLDNFLKIVRMPPALERIDKLIQLLAEKHNPGEPIPMYFDNYCAAIGTEDSIGMQWVVTQAIRSQFVESQNIPVKGNEGIDIVLILTAKGWERYADLMRNGAGSRHAFMAMDFNAREINQLFEDHLRQAVAQTGFELRTTRGDHQTAGLIDNRMRVEIRTSRFVICDLSDGNRGAYWEAGFAEGIGRPVFYICSAETHDSVDRNTRPHFDAAHQVIVKWNPADPGPASEELKALIRATLPAEARMTDD